MEKVLDKFRLDGKVALVTGALRGLGQGMAVALAEAGADVVAADIGRSSETCNCIQRTGRRCETVEADVAAAGAAQLLVDRALAAFGRLDILVNNAGGIPERGPVLALSEEGFKKTLDVNLTSAFLCSKQALPELIKTKGNIVNVASLAGLRGAPNNTAYGVAKGGMVILTKDMAVDYAPQGVRVNAICPAYVETDLNRELLANMKKTGEYEALVKMHLLGRLGEPDDVAYAAVYLASDEAKWITGTTLSVDGGISATR